MAGTIIQTPTQGESWANFETQVEYGRKGQFAITLGNWDTDSAAPTITSGSWAEVAGSIYNWASAESISGSASSGTNYIKLVPSGSGSSAIVTATWTTTTPTWSESYQGWYSGSGTSRVIGGCYYDGSDYTKKFVYVVREIREYNLDDEAVSADKIIKSTTYGTQNITNGSSWTPAAGIYIIATVDDIRLQIYSGSSWVPAVPQADASFDGVLITDGTNFRLYNAGGSTTTAYYRKLD